MFTLNRLRWLPVAAAVGMFIVLLGGVLVTKTESGRGCGDDWPLCNGKFIPAYTIESMIEYSHRAVSGTVGLLVLATALWIWRAAKKRQESEWKEAAFYAFTALFFTFLQAILGAMAVKWGQIPAVMALHFGFSLIAFAGTLLAALTVRKIYLKESRIGDSRSLQSWGRESQASRSYKAHPPAKVSKSFQYYVWATAIYSYIVVYIGAFVRHTESSGGCIGWPLCNGEVIPPLSGATGISFMHRLAALLLLIMVTALFLIVYKCYKQDRGIWHTSIAVTALLLMQVLSGALVSMYITSENLYLLFGLLHAVIVAALFGMLCYLSILVWKQRDVKQLIAERGEGRASKST
jgi:cytochrome c oxidase assembly protein subunit 15